MCPALRGVFPPCGLLAAPGTLIPRGSRGFRDDTGSLSSAFVGRLIGDDPSDARLRRSRPAAVTVEHTGDKTAPASFSGRCGQRSWEWPARDRGWFTDAGTRPSCLVVGTSGREVGPHSADHRAGTAECAHLTDRLHRRRGSGAAHQAAPACLPRRLKQVLRPHAPVILETASGTCHTQSC